ncbi:MAG TPA: PEGA domain-containing protein, partial [Terriglobales bacterium]|nr:PEGA domain-containing protein [Terriglobales bacterium]
MCGEHADLTRVAEEIETRRRDAAVTTITKATNDARMLLLGRSYQTAIELLDAVGNLLDYVPDDLHQRYYVIHEEADAGLARQKRQAELANASTSEHVTQPETQEQGEHDETDIALPAGRTAVARGSASIRDRDLTELARLERDSETATDASELQALSARARVIAGRHQDDPEIQAVATSIANTAVTRAEQYATEVRSFEPPPQSSATSTMAPAEIRERRRKQDREPAPSEANAPQGPAQGETDLSRTSPSLPPIKMPPPPPVQVQQQAGNTLRAPEPVAPSPPAGEPFLTPAAVKPKPAAQQEVPSANRESERAPDLERRAPIPFPVPAPTTEVPSHRSSLLIYVGAAVAILLVIAGAVWKFRSGISTGRSATPEIVTAVNSSPTGATIRVGNASCVTPNCRLKLPVGDNTLQASLPGYAPVSKIIHVDQRSGSPAVEFNLNALPSVVRVNTNFASGDVSLDGQPYGTLQSGQLVLNAVAEGEHKLQVTGPDGNAEVAFSASPAQQPKLSSPISANNISALVVSSLGNRVRLDCNCGPETKLAVDGRALGGVGAGGRELTELAQGSHELQLGEGDETRTHIVNVEAAPALNIFLDSERQVGTLLVQAGVENANVFIGGRKVGRTGADGVFRAPLPAQDVSVRVEKSGFEPVPPQTAQIRKNREMGLMFELRPAARKAPAYLSIMDASPDASVMVDG